jgi:nitrite reductase/ring-hydroxylating ferredoxin subunit
VADGERVICKSETLAEGGLGVRFPVGEATNGFVVRFNGAVRGYVNRCPHMGTELDWQPGELFDESGAYLVCSTHGALFEPSSGRCIAGPCRGASLDPIATLERDGKVCVVEDGGGSKG